MKKYWLLLLFSLLFSNIFAQTHTWTGNGNDFNWFNSSNWDTNAVPSSFELAIIPENFYVEIIDEFAQAGIIQIYNNATLSIENNLTLNQSIITSQEANIIFKSGTIQGNIINNGVLLIESIDEKDFNNSSISNHGIINVVNSGTIHFNNDVTILNSNQASIIIESPGGFVEQSGTTTFNNDGLIQMPSDELSRAYYMIFDINNSGVIDVGENQMFLFLVGSQNLNNMETGRLEGKGTLDITANFTNSGIFSPAGINSIGTLDVVNNFSFSIDAELEIEIEGSNGGEYDRIAITGFPTIEGKINIDLKYAPILGEEFIVITANEITSCDLPEYLTSVFEGEEFYFEVICETTMVKLRVTEEVLNTEEFTSEEYNFYVQPNPVTETIYVVFNTSEESLNSFKNLSVSLFNILGQKVRTIDQFSIDNNMIQRGNLGSGLYILQLSSEKNILATTKLIIN